MTLLATLVLVARLLADGLPPETGGLLGGGGIAAAAIGAIVWLIRHNAAEAEKARVLFAAEMKEAREDFSDKIDALTAKFEATLAKKDEQITGIVNKFDAGLREMRTENQRNVERQFEHSREVVAALEHVNAALHELAGRVDAIDGAKTSLPAKKRPTGGSGEHRPSGAT